MYKAFLDTLKQAGIELPSWIFVMIAILLACAIIAFVIKKYIVSFVVRIVKIYKDICSIEELKQSHIKAMNESMSKDKELEEKVNALDNKIDNIVHILNSMNEKSNETKMIEMQDRLVQMYRFYTAPEHNSQWSEVEADTFWKVFRDYEKRGGNGYMHQIVEPAMRELKVISIVK